LDLQSTFSCKRWWCSTCNLPPWTSVYVWSKGKQRKM